VPAAEADPDPGVAAELAVGGAEDAEDADPDAGPAAPDWGPGPGPGDPAVHAVAAERRTPAASTEPDRRRKGVVSAIRHATAGTCA
jgi:hypothetical protein